MTTEIKPFDPSRWSKPVPSFRSPERCWNYMKRNGFGRLPPKTELVFLKDLDLAIKYARQIESRLPPIFEQAIKNDGPDRTWQYVSKVFDRPMPEFEETLSKSPAYLVKYAQQVVKGRLSEDLEANLAGDPYACFEYAYTILDGQLPERLHNFMFCATLSEDYGRRYWGHKYKLNAQPNYEADFVSPSSYFDWLKWQRKNLHKQIEHYSNVYKVDPSRSVGDLLKELESGK